MVLERQTEFVGGRLESPSGKIFKASVMTGIKT